MTMHYIRLMKELLITDLMIMKQKLPETILNTLIWSASFTLAATYVLPYLGMTRSYSSMVLIGSIVSCGIFEIFGNTSIMVADITGEKTISYQLTLPLPGWMLLAQKALANAIHSAILTLFILPIGKLIMGSHLVVSAIHPAKFAIAFVMLHLFCGFFGLVMTAYTMSMDSIINVWVRMLFPLWFFGGSQFNWHTLYEISPILAYLNLANPLTYAFEAIKGASLAGELFLPFWACIGMMIIASMLFLYIGNRKLQQRLDYL